MGAHVSVPMYRRGLPQRLRMEGGRCAACGLVEFPPRPRCINCGSTEVEGVPLSGRGRIHTWTFITPAGAPPEFSEQARRTGGYYVAIVALEDGPFVTGQMVAEGHGPAIDDPVEVVVRRLYEEEGVIRYGFKFRLAGTTQPPDRDTRSSDSGRPRQNGRPREQG